MPILSHESIAKRGLEGCKMIDGLACCKSCLLTAYGYCFSLP